jgi:hypothetical protein
VEWICQFATDHPVRRAIRILIPSLVSRHHARRSRFTPGGGIFSGRHDSFLPLKRIRQIATFGQETKDQRLLAVVERRLATTATGISSRGAWRDPVRHFAGRKATRRPTCQFAYFSGLLGDRGIITSRVGTDILGEVARDRIEVLGLRPPPCKVMPLI